MRESKKSCDGDIFIYIFPVNANAVSNEFPLLPLFVCSTVKSWEPCERRTNLTSIRKADVDMLIIEVNACCRCGSIV